MFQSNFDTPGICRCSLCIWVESTQLNFIVSSEKKSKYEIEFNCGGQRLDKKAKKGQQMDYRIMHWISSLDEKAKKRKEDENQ